MLERFVLAVALLSGACASTQQYSIAVIGDLPYVHDEAERQTYLPRYDRLLANLNASDVKLVVHLGDFTTGPFCGDSVVNQRYGEFERSTHPFLYIFGDNDWTDCARGGFDPLERLDNLRRVFTQGNTTLGRTKMAVIRQSADAKYAKYRENVRFVMGSELYITLNVQGSNNGWGRSEQPTAEHIERNNADLDWLRQGFEIATREHMRGVVVFMQADPGTEDMPWKRKPADLKGFVPLINELSRLAIAFGKPVMLFHGDSHYFRIDHPFNDPATGRVIANLTRVEAYAHPNYHWLRLVVDRRDREVFRIVREIIPEHAR
jgi:predicted phosphodiesterase